MGAEVSKSTINTGASTEALPLALQPVLVVLTVPNAKPLEGDLEQVYNNATATELTNYARALDRMTYPPGPRQYDRRAVQAALLLRAAIIQHYPRARVVIIAMTEQWRQHCMRQQRTHCTLETRVREMMPGLLDMYTGRRLHIELHSFPTKGLAGDVLAANDRRGCYVVSNSGTEVSTTSLRGYVVEKKGSAANVLLSMFPREYRIPSVLIDFYEDRAACVITDMAADMNSFAHWIMLEFNIMHVYAPPSSKTN